jgi:integrase
MARTTVSARLTVAKAKALIGKGAAGRYADGGNLYLYVTGSGRALWSFRFMRHGKAREMGLGVVDLAGTHGGVTLVEARERAAAALRMLRDGRDPIEVRREAVEADARRQRASRPFREVAELYIAAHEAGWRSAAHRTQWRRTLDTYVNPTVGDTPVADLGAEDVLRVLAPIWAEKPETASRVRGRIEAVLDYAAARGWRQGENPARWRGHLAHMLPARRKLARVEHHPALPWQDVPAFVAELRAQTAVAARALEFTILTAARTGEALGARWSEIDLDAAVWTVPAARMKGYRAHRVPLSGAALAVLRHLLPLRQAWGSAGEGGFVFPGLRPGQSLSRMAMLKLLERMGRGDLTVHGFRSAFRDWASEATHAPHAVAEAALAHAVPSATEAAYRRGDLFEKRRALMQDWADHCGRTPAEVVALRDQGAEATA